MNKEELKKLETMMGGYCYMQDGGSGGYDFDDIVSYINTIKLREIKKDLINWVENNNRGGYVSFVELIDIIKKYEN
jgi:hypothetical protein